MAADSAESAAIDQAVELLGGDPARSRAMRATIAALRMDPDLPQWRRTHDTDSARRRAVEDWHRHPSVAAYLKGSKHRERDAENLLEAAGRFMDDEDERLATVWAYVTSTPEWAALPRSAKDLYKVLHAKARERGELGGPRVAMCHTLAKVMIEAATGRPVRSLGTITNARVALVAAGFIASKVGEPHRPKARRLPTVYNLLPVSLVNELCLFPRLTGIVHFPSAGGDGDSRPQWSDRDRRVFWVAVTALRDGLRREYAEAAAREAGQPVMTLADFASLAQAEPPPGDREPSAAPQEGSHRLRSAAAEPFPVPRRVATWDEVEELLRSADSVALLAYPPPGGITGQEVSA